MNIRKIKLYNNYSIVEKGKELGNGIRLKSVEIGELLENNDALVEFIK